MYTFKILVNIFYNYKYNAKYFFFNLLFSIVVFLHYIVLV